jgi:hypothetical protein
MFQCPTEAARIKNAVDKHAEMATQNSDLLNISESELTGIIQNLSNNKAVGPMGISNEMLKNSLCPKLIEIVKYIMELILNENVIPNDFNKGKIIPIPKDDSKSLKDIANVRPLTISDCFSNIYEYIIIIQIEKLHNVPPLQFGFRKNSSCNHAIFTLTELIKHNKSMNKNVFACAIDASKAFDKVERMNLYYKLINVMDCKSWLSLKSYYDASKAFVVSNGETSDSFKTEKGVNKVALFHHYYFQFICKIS